MVADAYLVLGIVIVALGALSGFNALLEWRFPSAGLAVAALGAGLIALAISQRPGGYRLEDLPALFLRVVRAALG